MSESWPVVRLAHPMRASQFTKYSSGKERLSARPKAGRSCFHIMEESEHHLRRKGLGEGYIVAYRLLPLLFVSLLAPCLPAWAADAPRVISAERIKADVTYLAGDRLEGRGPGTRGEFLATEYIAA